MSHVRLDIEVDSLSWTDRDKATALVTLENSGKIPKKINYAVLIVTNENENIDHAISKVFDKNFKSKTEAVYYINKAKIYDKMYGICGSTAFIPIPYFFSEQTQIGNEKIKYRSSIDLTKLEKNTTYVVKVYVFMKHFGFVRWRSSSDLLII